MFTTSTRRELEGERERLKRRMSAIDQLLAEDKIDHLNAVVMGSPEVAANGNGDDGFSDLGLRDAARKVLEDNNGRGLKPKAVVERMEALGFKSQTGATTPLITRVRNELWRMARRGELRSNKGAYFARRDAG